MAQAAGSPRTRCQQEAASLTGLDLTGNNLIVGKNKHDNVTSQATAGPDVFCGRGGDSTSTLDADDIFIGGAGKDSILYREEGAIVG